MRFKIIFLAGIALILSACGSTQNRIPIVKLTGINGEALYTIDAGGKVVLVTRESYQTSDYNIVIRTDTVSLGDDFVGMFAIMKSHYKIIITSPSPKIITSDIPDDENYVFIPTKVGTYQYRGQVEYDSTIVPFSYDFIVVP